MIKYFILYLYSIYVVRRFYIKVFYRFIVYEFLVGLFDCYYFCFKVFFVILRDGENLVVL